MSLNRQSSTPGIFLTSTPQLIDTQRASTARRIAWALLIAATLYICLFSNLNVIGFVGPDEPRYAWIARDMAESGDWVTPRLYGRPWFEKPPLLYWGGAIFFKLMPSQPEIAARLPSSISALLATLALAWLAWRTYGEECARWLLLLLPTSVGMIGFSHACATDMPFAGMLTIALVCAAVVLGLARSPEDTPILPRTPWLTIILFGFFMGLAVLAKGPAALILMGGGVFFWALFTKRWHDAVRLLHPAAVAAFCVTTLPWYILCARRNPDFLRVFIIEHNFKRYLTPEFQHIQPFWFYLPVLAIALAPWSLLGGIALIRGFAHFWKGGGDGEVTRLTLPWIGFCLLFFTVSKSKLPGYVLPSLPAIGLLMASARTSGRWLSLRSTRTVLILSGSFYLVGATFVRLAFSEFWDISLISFLVLISFSLSTLAIVVSLGINSNSAYRLVLHAAAVAFFCLPITLAPMLRDKTRLNLLSGKALWQALPSEVLSSPGLRLFGFRRDFRYTLSFYLHREVTDWNEDRTRDGYVVSNWEKKAKPVSCDDIGTSDSCESARIGDGSFARWTLLRVTPRDSLSGSGSRRQLQ